MKQIYSYQQKAALFAVSLLAMLLFSANGLHNLSDNTNFSPDFNIPDVALCVGETTMVTGPGTPDGVDPYISSNPFIATVDANGLVTGMSFGTTQITYTDDMGATCMSNVEVNKVSAFGGGTVAICNGSSTTLISNGYSFCNDGSTSTLLSWDLDGCHGLLTTGGVENNEIYDEFAPNYVDPSGDISGTGVFRTSPGTNVHACTDGFDGTPGSAISVSSRLSCGLNGDSKTVRFSVTVSPTDRVRLTRLSFYERAPENWSTSLSPLIDPSTLADPSSANQTGINNYPRFYSLQIYKDGVRIVNSTANFTTTSWSLEEFDFTNIPEFEVTSTSVFSFELLGRCPQASGGDRSMWDLDNIKLEGRIGTTDPDISYLWSNGETTPSITVSPSSTQNYDVTISGCMGCSKVRNFGVTVTPIPAIIAAAVTDVSVCDQNDGEILLTFENVPDGVYYLSAYNFNSSNNPSFGEYITVANNMTTLSGLTSGLYQNLSINVSGCSPLVDFPVEVGDQSVLADLEICVGETIQLTASGVPAAIAPYVSSNIHIASVDDLGVVTGISYGETYITYSDNNGCREVTRVLVNEFLITSEDEDICLGESVDLTVSGTPYCQDNMSTLIRWDLEACHAQNASNGDDNFNDYSELIPSYVDPGGEITGTEVYRLNPTVNQHSCSDDFNGTPGNALCVGTRSACSYSPNNDKAIRFSVTVSPTDEITLTRLSFYELAPENWLFSIGPHIDPTSIVGVGGSGVNNYPTRYGIRILKDGIEIFRSTGNLTTTDWSLEAFDLTNIPEFEVTATAVFDFELLGYCQASNGGDMAVWDVDQIQLEGLIGSSNNPTVDYLWSTGESTPTITVSPTTTQDYEVTITGCDICSTVESINVLVHQIPAPMITSIIGTNATNCAGIPDGTMTLNFANVPDGTYNFSITYDNGNLSNTFVFPYPIVNNTAIFPAGTAPMGSYFNFSIQVNSLCNTFLTSDIVLIIGGPLQDAVLCVGETVSLAVPGAAAVIDPYVSSNPLIASVDANGLVTALSFGTTQVTYTDIDGNTCMSTVEVDELLVTISGDEIICAGETIELTAQGSAFCNNNNNPVVGYLWSTGETTPIISVSPITNQSYEVTVTSDCNACFVVETINVTVNSLPTITSAVGVNPSSCGGTDGEIILTFENVPDGIYDIRYINSFLTNPDFNLLPSYSGSIFSDVSVIANMTTITGLSVNDYLDLVIEVNGCNSESVDVELTDPNNPTLESLMLCVGETATIVGSGNAGSVDPYISSDVSIATITDAGLVTGVSAGVVTITYTDDTECVASAFVRVLDLGVSVSADQTICEGGSIDLTAQAIPDCSSTTLLSHWDFNDCKGHLEFVNDEGSSQGIYVFFNSETYIELTSTTSISELTASNTYRMAGELHSCTDDRNGNAGDALCVSASPSCNWMDNSLEALHFSTTITPTTDVITITGLNFYALAPENWLNSSDANPDQTGVNNYPSLYGVRILKDGVEIYSSIDLPTSNTWRLEEFDLTGIPEFTVTTTAVFEFELLSYCIVPNGGNRNIWDLDDIQLLGTIGTTDMTTVDYLWSTGETTPTITVNPSVDQTYEVTVTGCGYCTSIETVNVMVDSDPVIIAAIGTNPSFCDATDGSISFTFSNVADGTHTLSYVDEMLLPQSFPNIAVVGGMATVTGLTAGVYNNIQIITNVGCTSVIDIDIELFNPCFDFGDLPQTFTTIEADPAMPMMEGPKHLVSPLWYMGICIDTEADGQPDQYSGYYPASVGDDNSIGLSSFPIGQNCVDDENGVVLKTPIIPGYEACFDVMTTGPMDGVMQAWIDNNGNNVFDGGEEVTWTKINGTVVSTANATVIAGTDVITELCYIVPPTATFPALETYLRFRYSENGNLNYKDPYANGNYPLGEVEDYYQPLAELGDYVWHDTDGDGVQDMGELPVENVVVNLHDCTDALNPLLIATTTTDATGFYEFIGLIPMEKYCVEFDLTPINAPIADPEDHFVFTFMDSPNADATDDNDSDADNLGFTVPVMMMDRERNESLDAGIYIPASLGDYVWVDINLDGIQNNNEPAVEGAKLFLSGTNNIGEDVPTGQIVPVGQPIPPTMLVTDANGFYHFGGLAPGSYQVTFDLSMITAPTAIAEFTALIGFTLNDEDPADVKDSDVDSGGIVGTTPFYDLTSGQHVPLLDAGVAIPCLPPTDIWVDMTMITTATLHWTVNNSPLDPSGIDTYAHCWNIAIGATGFEPWENEAVQLIMVCHDDPNITIIGDQVSYDLTGLQPGTCYDIYIQEGCNGLIPPNSTYGWVNAPGTPQIGDLLGNPLLSTDVNPDGLCTFDDPEIVTILPTSPSCPYISPGYAPNGSFTVQVEDGVSCGNTLYDIVITPVVNSTPGNSTPIATTPTQYLGVAAGTYIFANVDAGSYTVVVTEQGPCNPKNDPQTHLVVIADGVDDEDPDKVVTDILGNVVPTDMGTIIIPEGACHYQLQLFLQADDTCDGPIIADGAVWTSVVMTPNTIFPGTQSSVTSNGNGFYRIDVDFATGTTELTVHVTDISGNITEMTYTVTVEDNTAPDVSIVGANNTTIPHCEDEIDITVTVYIDDACDQDIDPANVNFNANGTEVLNFDGGNYFEYIVTVTTQDNGAIWSASYTDADGNTGFADIAITVEQAVADADPVIIAADENISQLNCDDDEVCYSFQVWDDCEAIDIAAVTFDAGGANMTLTYIDDQSQTNVAFFEACGIVSEGTYVMTIQYGGQSVQPILNVNAQDNQAPVITMPGNLNFTLPVCEGELQTTIAVQITDECDNPINPGNVTVTLGGITLDVNDAYITGGYYEWVITLDASNDGDLLIASYTDADGATTTVDALITVTTQPDNWGPIVIYPSQNINVEIDECDDAVEIVCFEVTATDNCDGELTPSVTLNGEAAGIILPSPGGDTYCVALAPGEHHVVISVTDAAGNTTEEDFFIVVTQDEAPDVNLACLGTFNATLGENCEAELIAANVLTGEWACLTEDDFIVTVIDDNPYNGGIIDGCGTYQYTISLNQEATVNGFTGPFASANWSVVQAAPASSVSINASTMVLSSTSANVDAMSAIAMPSDGTLSFDYDFIADIEFGIGWDYFIIDINGGVLATGNFDESGSISETVSAGNILVMTIEDDGFDAGTATLLTITNFVFEASNAVDAGDFTTCWGEVTAEDKTAPTIDCADDTDTALVNGQSHDLVCTDIDHILIDGIQTYATYADGSTIPNSISAELHAILSATGYPSITDNCGDVWVEVSDQVVENGDCGTVVITRTFNIHDRYNKCEDSAGQPMTASCTQIITLRKPTLAEVTLPAPTTSNECDEGVALDENGHPHPSVTGYPTIQTAFANHTINQTYCNLAANYSDTDLINICDGMYKFIRTWTLIDWCEPGQTFTYTQLIEVGDYTAPQIICGGSDADWDGVPDGPYQYSTGPFDCNASFEVPFPYSVTDNCSDYDLSTEIISIVEITLYNQWGQVIGTTMGEQLIATLAPGQYVSGVPMGEGILRYTATDDCGNASTVDCPFVVTDQVNPVAICDDDLHISIGGAGYARVYAEDVDEGSHDNCSEVNIQVRRAGGVWGEYVDFDCADVQNYVTIELQVWDEAGNSNLCWLEVLVEDKINPTCTAPHNETRHCDDDELLHIDWDNADQLNEVFGAATAEDNCNAIAEQVSVNNNLNDCGWGTVVRTFRAVDDWGLTSLNACQQVITVYEVHNYELKFPKDAEANCGTPNPDTIEYNTLACDLITVNVNDERFEASSDECYKVLRTYKVINWCEWDGESSPVVIQRDEDCDNNPGDEDVWVIVRTEWNGNDPIYTSYLDRDNSENNNNPFLGNNRCGTGTGQLPNGHWSNSNNNPELQSVGHWQYTQVIKVYDNEAPSVEVDDYDVFCGEYADCTGDVEITFTITEYCDLDVVTLEGFIDLYADGTQDGAATLTEDEAAATATTRTFTISGNYAIGAHAFGVHIEDGCHNITWLELPFDIADCKAPTPVCINGLTVTLMPQPDGCCAMAIWASDFIGSPITDCTEPIKYSIHRGDDVDAGSEIPSSDQTGIVLDCNDEATVVIYIYAWDSANNPYSVQPDGTLGGPNYDFCDTYVLVQNHISCPEDDPARVAGTIVTELNEGVQAVEMELSGNMFQDVLTQNDGGYEFTEQAEMGYDYTVTPHLDVEAPNSVSTFDLVLITKHILGIQYLDSPYKIIAADINSSQTVTTADMIQLRKHILGIYEEYPNNTFWRFVDADYVFPDPSNPWLEAFPEVRNIAGLAQDEMQEDFIGVAIGDVNGSALPNFTSVEERNVSGLFAITTEDTKVKAGAYYRVSFTATDLEKVQGYQFTLTFDKTALSLTDIEYGVAKAENFGMSYVEEGLITTSWNLPSSMIGLPGGTTGLPETAKGAVLFTLVFHANASATLSDLIGISSRITRAEAYDNNGTMDVGINFTNGVVATAGFEVYQNTPNPFNRDTKIGFSLPQDAAVKIAIQDVAGKTLKLIRKDGKKGYNTITINAKTLGAAGVLYYTVSTENNTATKKMIVVE